MLDWSDCCVLLSLFHCVKDAMRRCCMKFHLKVSKLAVCTAVQFCVEQCLKWEVLFECIKPVNLNGKWLHVPACLRLPYVLNNLMNRNRYMNEILYCKSVGVCPEIKKKK